MSAGKALRLAEIALYQLWQALLCFVPGEGRDAPAGREGMRRIQIFFRALRLCASATAICRPWKRPFSMKISFVRDPATMTPAR